MNPRRDDPSEHDTHPQRWFEDDRFLDLDGSDTRPLSLEEREALERPAEPHTSLALEPVATGRWRLSGTIASTARTRPTRPRV